MKTIEIKLGNTELFLVRKALAALEINLRRSRRKDRSALAMEIAAVARLREGLPKVE